MEKNIVDLIREFNSSVLYTEKDSGDIALEHLAKLLLHIEELNKRISLLESKFIVYGK
jgi:hypothetical protein